MLSTVVRSLLSGFQSHRSLFLETLARFWRDWRASILMVEPDTAIRWQRAGLPCPPQTAPMLDSEIRTLSAPLRRPGD